MAKKELNQLHDDMRDVMRTAQGKRVIWAIMDMAGLMDPLPHAQPDMLIRATGRREVAVEIYNWVLASAPKAFVEILAEHADKIEAEALKARNKVAQEPDSV